MQKHLIVCHHTVLLKLASLGIVDNLLEWNRNWLLHQFNGPSGMTWISWHQKGKPFWILMKSEMMGGSGISWTICKSFAPRSRQIAMPVPHHSIFTGRIPFLLPNQ